MLFKKQNKKEEININNSEEEIVEEEVTKKQNLEYRELAEYVLQRFKVKKTEEKTDDEIIMEFSKLSDPNAEFDFTVNFPSGNLNTRRPTTRIDGIIWANKYRPEFIKTVVSDKEWLDIWMEERNKKISQEEFAKETFTSDKLLEKVLTRDAEFQDVSVKNNENIYKINLYNLLNILQEEYAKELEEGLGVSVPDIFTILNILAEMNYFNDFSDMCSKVEQEVTNSHKETYVEFAESENIDINGIINDFEEIDEDEIFEENDEEEDFFGDEDDDDLFK